MCCIKKLEEVLILETTFTVFPVCLFYFWTWDDNFGKLTFWLYIGWRKGWFLHAKFRTHKNSQQANFNTFSLYNVNQPRCEIFCAEINKIATLLRPTCMHIQITQADRFNKWIKNHSLWNFLYSNFTYKIHLYGRPFSALFARPIHNQLVRIYV